MLSVQLEGGLTFENHVELLLSARMFVVLFDEGLIGTTRHQDVGAEGVDPQCVLERVPRRIAWLAVGNPWE